MRTRASNKNNNTLFAVLFIKRCYWDVQYV